MWNKTLSSRTHPLHRYEEPEWPESFTELWWPQLHSHRWGKGLSSVPTPADHCWERFSLCLFLGSTKWEKQPGVCPQAMERAGKYRTIFPRKRGIAVVKDEIPAAKLCRHRCPCSGASPVCDTRCGPCHLPWGWCWSLRILSEHKTLPCEVLSCLCLEHCNQNKGK